MTAKGKINASKVQINDRIIVQVREDGTVRPSETKTGEGVQVARITDKTFGLLGRGHGGYGRATRFYQVTTTAGTFEAAPIQTMWLAPEDPAGIKRAQAEAELENTERAELAAAPVQEAEEAPADETPADPRQWATEGTEYPYTGGRSTSPNVDDLPNPDGSNTLPIPAGPWFENEGAEDLTLNSHAGKVDSMNSESATETQTVPGPIDKTAILAKRIDSLMDSGVTQNHTGSTVVSLLEKVWSRIREDHPELPEVVITTGSGEGVKWGHFRAESWKVRAEEGAVVSDDKMGAGRRHELFLASEALAKGAHQVLQTMLHEGAHTLSRVRDVKDTSRQGRWHNATFRKAAEEMGLEHKGSAADKSHGFSFVTLTTATKERYADLLAELDREIRLTGLLPAWLGGTGDEDERGGEKITGKPTKGEGSTSGNLKLRCLCEEPNIIRASKKVADKLVVKCGDCEEFFAER